MSTMCNYAISAIGQIIVLVWRDDGIHVVNYFRHEYDFPPHFPHLRLSQDVIEDVKFEGMSSVTELYAPINRILRHTLMIIFYVIKFYS